MIETLEQKKGSLVSIEPSTIPPKDIDWRAAAWNSIKDSPASKHRRIQWLGIIDLMQLTGKEAKFPLLFFNPNEQLREDCFYVKQSGYYKPMTKWYFYNFESVFDKILEYLANYQKNNRRQQFLYVLVEEVVNENGAHYVSALVPKDGSVGYVESELRTIQSYELLQWIEAVRKTHDRITILREPFYH